MARLHYYQFPDNIDAHTRFLNGALNLKGDCTLGKSSCRECPVSSEGWQECPNYKCEAAENIISGTTVSNAKRLLKAFGGFAWTEHCERNGGVFEVTEIKLQGNNSRYKYNRHL